MADLTNQRLPTLTLPTADPLDDQDEVVMLETPMKPSPSVTPSQSSQPPHLQARAPSAPNAPNVCDPSLPFSGKLAVSYIDIFMDDL